MIVAVTEVKSIECLLFKRYVRSKKYFDQMKGFMIIDHIAASVTIKKDDLEYAPFYNER